MQQCWNKTIEILIVSLLALAIAKIFIIEQLIFFVTTLPTRRSQKLHHNYLKGIGKNWEEHGRSCKINCNDLLFRLILLFILGKRNIPYPIKKSWELMTNNKVCKNKETSIKECRKIIFYGCFTLMVDFLLLFFILPQNVGSIGVITY